MHMSIHLQLHIQEYLHIHYTYYTQACTGELPASKRKAKYCSNPERASYKKRSRKASAKAAIAARWQKEHTHPLQLVIHGSRIMNVDELSKSITQLTAHSAKCGGVCFLQGEIQHAGLAVVLAASCNKCMQEFRIHSSTIASQSASKKWSINLAAVLSQMETGGGHFRLNIILTTMDIPGMQKAMFKATEEFLGEAMKRQLLQSMAEVGQEERSEAIAKNLFHQGVPYISVVADGGWS